MTKKTDASSNRPAKHQPAPDNVDDILSDPEALQRAFEAVKNDMAAVDKSALVPVSVNGREVARMLLARTDRINSLRPAIVRDLPNHPIHLHDKLANYALAFWYTFQQWSLASDDSQHLEELLERASSLRKLLLSWAPTAVLWSAMTQQELDAIQAGSGYSDTADDAIALGRLSLERWDKLNGKVGYAREDAEQAVVTGQALLKALGERDIVGKQVSLAKEQWQRAYAVLSAAYVEVQAAVAYVRRHEGDASDFAPSLFSTRRAGRKAGGSKDKTPAGDPSNSTPVT